MPITYLSEHARIRLQDRCSISEDILCRMIDSMMVVHVGNEPATNREHLLFFSPRDNEAFVAIRDKLHGEIVTVLPLDFHQNLAWPIAAMDISKAKIHAIGQQRLQHGQTSVFVLKAHYTGIDGARRTKNLAKIPSSTHDNNIMKLRNEPGFAQTARLLAARAGVDAIHLREISITLGNRGEPFFFNIKPPTDVEIEEIQNSMASRLQLEEMVEAQEQSRPVEASDFPH